MTTDTSAEALDTLIARNEATACPSPQINSLLQDNADTLRALAAEKRRAREGVTEEMVKLACRKYYNSGHKVYPPVFEAMRAALEAVWPNGREAKDASCES